MYMKERAKAWLYALILGIVLPGVLFSVAEKTVLKPAPTVPTDTPTQPQETQTASPDTDTLLVVQSDGRAVQMDMDTYLTGVLLGEIPTEFDIEALKAQAVVARTYALKRQNAGSKHTSGGVCTDSACCQSYCSKEAFFQNGGTQQALDKVIGAVEDTEGQVLTYKGQLIEATYFSCSGGRTEDAVAVWGTELPYLQAVDSPGEENAAHYLDQVTFTASEFASRLGISPQGKPVDWFGAVTYTDGGGVNTMMIADKLFAGTTLRKQLGLRSTAFTVMPMGDQILISTKGFGHRVGMSQYGAEAMAVGGSTYQEILAHYYPGTQLAIN